MALMILNGDNRKIFIGNEVFYKIGENVIEEYRKEDFTIVRRKDFFRVKAAKEFDGKYYFLTKKMMLVYEDLFGDPIQETEVPNEGVFDFHMHDGRLFYLVKKMNRCLGIDEKQDVLFDFQAGVYFWDAADFYICSNRSLIRFDIVRKKSEEVLCNVHIRCLSVRNGMIAYADDANILHFLKGKTSLSYHYHSRTIVRIIITALEGLLVLCKDRKLVRIETRRDEKVFLTSFEGYPVDFIQDGTNIYVMTTFCVLVYDSKAGHVKKQIFSLPSFDYCKPLGNFEHVEEEIPGKEIFEHNVKRTKVNIPYVFKKECTGKSLESLIVAVRRNYVFIYDLEEEDVKRIAYLEGSDCFYSSGCVVRLSYGGKSRRATASIYRIENEGLGFIRKYDSIGISATPEDIVLDRGRLFLYLDGGLTEVIGPGITKRLGNENIRQIEETKAGVFLLDGCGIFKIKSGEWILEDRDITSFRISEGTLFVSLFGSGIYGFEMKDGAIEEKLINDTNVMEVFSKGGETIVALSLCEGVPVLRRYRKRDGSWKKDGEVFVDKKIGKILHKDIYLSITNRLHKVEVE
ncbi:WD40 domain-containing protein [Encephalitozoon hellem]|uniref:WD40 domain-containing protein n=1 Tax=Encephalitozoon hellem TaxID=27973 RepID=A0ABY8CGI2_ENCHE|nr:WD40 domain-containing protein [Encephalitozoon hellem]